MQCEANFVSHAKFADSRLCWYFKAKTSFENVLVQKMALHTGNTSVKKIQKSKKMSKRWRIKMRTFQLPEYRLNDALPINAKQCKIFCTMLDRKFILENVDAVKLNCQNRHVTADVDGFVALERDSMVDCTKASNRVYLVSL